MNLSNYSDKVKMPKSTKGCQIKSFIPVKNMNFENLIDTLSNINTFNEVSLK